MKPLAMMILVAGLATAAPIPKRPPVKPLAYGYIGVRLANTAILQIEEPEPGTPAYYAGLRGGDSLVRLGSLTPTTFEQVAEYILTLRPGTRISVDVRRNDRIITLWLTLGVRPEGESYPNPFPTVISRMKGRTNDDD